MTVLRQRPSLTVLRTHACLSGSLAGILLLLPWATACNSNASQPVDPALVRTAEAATESEDWTAAASHWNRILLEAKDPGPRPYLEAARAMWELGDQEAAGKFLDRGITLFPKDVELLLMRGKLLCSRGFRRAAELDFLAVTEVQPDNAEAWLLLGQMLLELSLPARAAVCLEHHLRLQGQSDEALFLLGRACAEGGDLASAMTSFAAALDDANTSPELLIEAAAMVIDERFAAARQPFLVVALVWVDRALALDPQHAEGNFVRGRLIEMRGDEAGALEAYLRTVELDNFHLLAMTRAAEIYARRGDVARADEMVDRALDLNITAARRRTLERLRASWH